MKHLAIVVSLALLAGCASIDPVTQEPTQHTQQQAITRFSDINYSSIPVYDKPVKIERVIDQNTQILSITTPSTTDSLSPVVAWKLPSEGAYRIKLESFVQRSNFGNSAHAFVPEIWLLDKDYKILTKRSSDHLNYDQQSMLTREALSDEFILNNLGSNQNAPAYLLIVTTDKARQKQFVVANMDAEYAKVRGRLAPPVPDVQANAADTGTIRLTVTPLMSFAQVKKPVKPVPTPDYVPAVPDIVKKSSNSDWDKVAHQQLSSIEQAIESGQITQAMKQRSSVRKAHAELQSLFQSAYGKDMAELNKLEAQHHHTDTGSMISNQYKVALIKALKKGDIQGALALVDQSEQLVWKVDLLFKNASQ